ncbi:MAG: sulfatase, partial [Nitrospirae bacterium]|nr:sulfatase [Nitrospirota bacterium]
MNDQKTGQSFSDTLFTGLTFWLAGGMLFWLTELSTLLLGLPFTWAFKRAKSTGVSTKAAVASILSLNEIASGFLSYAPVSLVAGIICAVFVHALAGKKDGVKSSALSASVSLAFTFFIFSVFWVNIKYLPDLLSLKSILVNIILLALSIGIAYVFFKGRVTEKHESLFASFIAYVFVMDVFLLGELLLLRILSAKLLSLKGLAISAVFIMFCGALFFLLRRGLRSGRFDGLDPRSVKKWVFAVSGALAACSGLVVLMTLPPGKAESAKNRAAVGAKPNVLFIVMDTTRADHLSCYGYNRKTSPYLDRIAGEGALFKNAVSTSGWTLPSHVSMFTGLFPLEHGTGHVTPHLPEEIETLTGLLKEQGYATLGYSNNPWVSFFTGLSRKFDDFQVGWKRNEHRYFYKSAYDRLLEISKKSDPDWATNDHGAARTTRYVSEWMEKNAGAPFYVFINYMEPHLPYDPPPPYNSLFMPDGVSSEELRKFSPPPEDIRTLMVQRERGEKELAVINALYDGELNYLDGRIWKLYEKLKELNVLDNTMIIITSDHGDNLGEHGIVGHAYGLFNTLIDVPLIIRYPKYF